MSDLRLRVFFNLARDHHTAYEYGARAVAAVLRRGTREAFDRLDRGQRLEALRSAPNTWLDLEE